MPRLQHLKKNRIRLNLLCLAAALSFFSPFVSRTSHAEDCVFMVGSINAQRLAPSSKKEQPKTRPQFLAQTRNLIEGVSTLNGDRGPDILTLSETSPESFVRMSDASEVRRFLYNTKGTSHFDHEIGILSRLPPSRGATIHRYWDPQDPIWLKEGSDKPTFSRPILEVPVRLPNGEELTIFINHWPSRGSGLQQRIAAARYLHWQVWKILQKNPDANVLLIGDFNTHPADTVITDFLQASPLPADSQPLPSGPALFNLSPLANLNSWKAQYLKEFPHATAEDLARYTAWLQTEFGTFYSKREGRWHAPDQMFISKNMLKYYVPASFQIVRSQPFGDSTGYPAAFDPTTSKGITDHAPITAKFRVPRRSRAQ
jgi:hypothetical protein